MTERTIEHKPNPIDSKVTYPVKDFKTLIELISEFPNTSYGEYVENRLRILQIEEGYHQDGTAD